MRTTMRIFTIVLLAFFLVKGTFSQPVKGKKFEFSTSASMWNIKVKGEETETIVNLPLRIGYFIFKGLQVEPEFRLTIPEESEDTGYLILINLAYNFKASEKAVPFILVGGGYGNGQAFYDLVIDQDMGITALNFGAGLKYFVGDSAAIRIEYRFTKYSGEKTETYWWGTFTSEVDRKDNNLLVGLSIFF